MVQALLRTVSERKTEIFGSFLVVDFIVFGKTMSVVESSSGSNVEQASKFLAYVLRHSPEEYGISLNSRGWASVKDIRVVLNREFDERGGSLLKDVLDADDENRFQLVSEDGLGFVRATRGHSAEDVDLLEVCPDEEELSWYLVEYDERECDYVEAVSSEAALRVVEERISARSADEVSGADVSEVDGTVTVCRAADGHTSDSLTGNTPPFRVVYQDGRKPVEEFKRINQMGADIGRYARPQPARVRSRLPP